MLPVALHGARAGAHDKKRRPALALLQRVADGDRSMTRRELRAARLMAETLLRVQQQTARLHEAVRAELKRPSERVG